jgi:hypothetical protein
MAEGKHLKLWNSKRQTLPLIKKVRKQKYLCLGAKLFMNKKWKDALGLMVAMRLMKTLERQET